MNKSFVITAVPSLNLLKIVLGGNFMKSEIEHALHLIKLEKMKLKEGFSVSLDLTNLESKAVDIFAIQHKILQVLQTNDLYKNKNYLALGSEFYN
jgi:hypothetical protein